VANTIYEFRRCLLVLTLSVAPVIALSTGLTWGWLHLHIKYKGQTIEAVSTLSRSEALIIKNPDIAEELNTLRVQTGKSDLFIQGQSPALAAAGLHEKVQQLATSYGGELLSTQVLDPVSEHGSLRVSIHFRIGGDEGTLLRILHKLEGGRPLLFIDNLSIQGNSRSTGRSGHSSSGQLKIGFDLIGYLPGEAG